MSLIGIVVAAVIVGLVVGILAGMLGIGGGTVLVPVFKLCFGMASIVCTATSLFTIVLTSISGSVSHIRHKTCMPKLGVAMGLGGACTSPLGVWLASISPGWLIMVVAACIVLYSAFTMFQKARAMPSRRAEGASGSSRPVDAVPPVPQLTGRQLALGVCIGFVAGVASGYAGVGGGFIMVPLVIALVHVPMKLTSGTSLVAVMILAVPGVITQALLGNVHWAVGIAVACGSIPGAAIGASLIRRIPERTLRYIFSAFLLVAAILIVVNELGVLG